MHSAMVDKKISGDAAVAEVARRYQALVDIFERSPRLTARKEQKEGKLLCN
jgi:myo-inositol catabolism protein IolC